MSRPTLIMTIALIGGIEILLRVFAIPEYLFPLPSQTFITLWESSRELTTALLETSSNALIGLALSTLGGVLLAFIISLSPWLRAGILPVALFFQTVPIIAIAPMLVIWFGFGAPTVIASSCIVSFFPILASSLKGLESTPKSALELFQLYRANAFETYLKLKLPFAVPWILNGLRISLGLAIVGALVGEFIAGGGLGSLIDSARTQQRADLVFAAVFASCILGWSLTAIFDFCQNHLLKKWTY